MVARRIDGDGSVYYDSGRDRWVAAISLPNKKRVVRRCPTETEALAALQELRRQHVLGHLVPPTKSTLPQWYDQWVASKPRRPSTLQVYRLSVARLVGEIGAVRLDRLTSAWIAQCLDSLKSQGMGSRNLQLAHIFLGTCLRAAAAARIITANPIDGVTRPEHTPRVRTRWSFEDAKKFIAHCERSGRWYAPCAVILATMGLRISEATALRWSSVDLVSRTVTISEATVFTNRDLHPGPTKTRAGIRTLAMTQSAWRAFRKLRERYPNAQPQDHVFITQDGRILRPQYIRHPLRTLCRHAGVTEMPSHELRHVAAALAWHASHDVLAVQKRLGHAKASTTLNTYAYLMRRDDETARAMDFMLEEPQEYPDDGESASPQLKERPHPRWAE